MKFGATIGEDLCLVNMSIKFVGYNSHWESFSSATECWVMYSH